MNITFPDWLIEILRQSPTLAVCLAVVWFSVKYITRQHEEHLKAINAKHEEHVRSIQEGCEKHLASKEGEIKRLVKDKDTLQKEKEALQAFFREQQGEA